MTGSFTGPPTVCTGATPTTNAIPESASTGVETDVSKFQLYGVAPVVLVNVLDPEKHKKPVAEQNYPVTDGKVYLPLEAIQASVTVKNNAAAEGEPGNYTAGTDYDTLYDGENLIVP